LSVEKDELGFQVGFFSWSVIVFKAGEQQAIQR